MDEVKSRSASPEASGVSVDGPNPLTARSDAALIRGAHDVDSPSDYRRELSPCYLWYPRDWRASRRVAAMTFPERGLYRECLDLAWDENGLPNDPEAIRKLTGASRAEWRKFWPAVRQMFVKGEDNRLRNPRQEKERAKQQANRENGRSGGLARGKRIASEQASQSVATHNPTATGTQSQSHTQSQSQLQERTDGRSKHPIFKGQRFTVFEWQFDDLRKMLGSHTEAFDLHSWFFDLDAKALKTDQVIPPRDGGKWLQAQTLAEAKRRGLPIADGTAPKMSEAEEVAAILAEVKRQDEAVRR